MDIGAQQIVNTIASSSAGYLSEYAPVFIFGIALALSLGIIGALIDAFTAKNNDNRQDI